MKINKLLFPLFLCLFVMQIKAQDFKLGKVSIAELQEKAHPKDPSANAAVLFKKGEVRFEYSQETGFSVITTVEARVKIYTKEGYNWANQEVDYRVGSSKENVDFSNAVTYNLVDGKIEKTKLKKEGEFLEKVNRYWDRKKITMPNVKEGSVIEYQYTVRSSNIGSLRDWNFQTSIPVNYSEYKTYIPEYFIYQTNQKGYVFPKVTVEKNPNKITFTSKERSGGDRIGNTKTTFSTETIDFIEAKTTHVGENLPAMKEEAYVNNIDNYTSSISYELSMTKYPNEPLKPYSSDWNAVVKTIYDYEDFGPELNKTGYFEDDLKTVLSGLTTADEKIKAILNYVKTNVKWNNYYGYSCNDGVKKAYKDKTGNTAEINLMLTAMLRYANLPANPVLLSTRSNGIAAFPNRTAFNYVIAAVETPTGFILLDASDKFSTPNVLPFRALNWVGRLVRKDGTSDQVNLMPKKVSTSSIMMNYSVDANGLVTGKLRKQQTEYNAMIFRDDVASINEDAYLEKLENRSNNIDIKEYSRNNEANLELPIMETYSFSGTNLSEIIGGKIYLKPLLFFTDVKNPFVQENREFPIDYGFPFLEKYTINISIPEGYKVEQLPAPAVITMDDNLGSFKFMTTSSESSIQLAISHEINAAIVPSDYYSVIKSYYQGMIDKQNEKIILTKI